MGWGFPIIESTNYVNLQSTLHLEKALSQKLHQLNPLNQVKYSVLYDIINFNTHTPCIGKIQIKETDSSQAIFTQPSEFGMI